MARKVSKGKKPNETMRQRQMRLRKEQQARNRGIVKSPRGSAVSTKVKPVNVTVEKPTQKQLPPSKSTKALPAGRQGGPVAANKPPRRRNVNTNPPSNTTRTGSQSPGAVRRELGAVRRARAEIGRNRMGPLSSIAEQVIERSLSPIVKRVGYHGAAALRRAAGGGEPTLDMNGKPIKKNDTPAASKPTKNTAPGTGRSRAQRSSSTNKPNDAAAINARLKKEREARAAALARTRGGNNSQILREAPGKGDPKRTSTSSTPPKSTPTKAAPARKPQSKDMDANYKAWAKANPGLAKKVKKGQSGYKSINPTPNKDSLKPKKRTWLADNYKPNKKKK